MADTLRVQVLIALAGEHYLSSPGLAKKDCEEAMRLSERIKYENGLVNACGWLAYLYEQEGEITLALEYNKKSLALAEKNGNKKDQASILNNMAAIYKDQGRIDEALKLHIRSLKLRIATGNKEGMATSYNNIGLIFASQGNIRSALDFYSRSLKIYEDLKIADGISTTLQNIGFVYREQGDFDKAFDYYRRAWLMNRQTGDRYATGYSLNGMGGLFEETGNNDSALFYYSEALKLRREIDDKQGVSYSFKNIGGIYAKLGRADTAQKCFEQSLKGFEELGDKWGMAVTFNKLGGLYLDMGDALQSEKYLNRSLQLAKELGYPTGIRDAADNLQQLYRRQRQWQRALQMTDLYITMRDSVMNDNNRKASLRMQFRYEYEKKEAKLKVEQDKRDALAKAEIARQKLVRNGFIAGFAVVLLFAVAVIRQRNRVRKEKKRSDELLLNILPEETAEELKETGTAKAKRYGSVSVLFTDFKNFTEAAGTLSPEELVAEINYCYSGFDQIMTRHNLEKIKTIGDSYMCAGGLPVSNHTHAEDCVRAALEIAAFINNRKEHNGGTGRWAGSCIDAGLPKAPSPAFDIRIGIHTGPVVAGIVGIKKFAYDIWGDTVNIASRMESSGEAGKVNISGATYELVKEKFICEYRGELEAKGKGRVNMYFVTQEKNR